MMPSKTGPKPANLPSVPAVLGVQDFGPCDGGEGSATCPHCGAQGRYVISFLCDDGTKRGAMSGCFDLFRGADTRTSKLVCEAFSRARDASKEGKKAASWWREIAAEADEFGRSGGVDDYREFAQRVADIDGRRQAWLKRNGYGRGGRR